MKDYRKYDVWERAHKLVLFVYKDIIPALPKSAQYELASQMRRAAYSVPLNIVEGCGRNTDKDFAHFLDMSLGSLQELEYRSLLVFDLEYLQHGQYSLLAEKINEVKAKLINLIKTVRK